MDSDDRAENGGRKEKKTEDKDHDVIHAEGRIRIHVRIVTGSRD